MFKEVKYELYKTRWIVDERKGIIVPAVVNNDETKIMLMDGSNKVLPIGLGELKGVYGNDVELLTYEQICAKYDSKYDGSVSEANGCNPKSVEEDIKACGMDTIDGFYPRYKHYKPSSQKQLQKIAKYLDDGRKSIESSNQPYQF